VLCVRSILSYKKITHPNIKDYCLPKILAYNVTGLQNKGKYCQFTNFVKQHDVFALFETFVTSENASTYNGWFEGYNLYWIPAKKSASVGRASGGCVLGIKLSLIDRVKYEHIDQWIVISVKVENIKLVIVPVYLNYNLWNEDFEKLKELLENKNIDKVIIIGDLNARIARLQTLSMEDIYNSNLIDNLRQSKDKILNTRGKNLLELCDNINLVILNGRTKSDTSGNFTCIKQLGSSVIDICCVSVEAIQYISDFEVKTEIYSEHMPIVLTLGPINKGTDTTYIPLLPRLQWEDRFKEKYIKELKGNFLKIDSIPDDTQEAITILTCCIRVTIEKNLHAGIQISQIQHNKWFNWECAKVRKMVFKLLNVLRDTGTDEIREKYMVKLKEYKALCNQKRNQYDEMLIQKFNDVQDSKEFWKIANKFKMKTFKVGSTITCKDFTEYFKKLLNPKLNNVHIHYAAPNIIVEDLDKQIVMEELKRVLSRSKPGKAPGFDQIPVEFYKNAPEEFLENLLAVFNKILLTGNIPDSFRRAIVFPLYKKGERNDVENYRGLSFLDAVAKLFTGIILNRMVDWMSTNNILNEYQAGFRKGYSTVDSIFSLVNIIQLKLASKGNKIYVFFVDLKAAFDYVDRDALFYKMSNYGMSTKIINILKSLFSNTSAGVWGGNCGVSDCFSTNIGLRQGCVLSPVLFTLFINDLHDQIEGGLSLGSGRIRVLKYADDIACISDSPAGLQIMINNLIKYCEKWNLQVNINKSKILIFKKGGGKRAKNEKWFYGKDIIEVVSRYKYLGVTLTSNLSFQAHLEDRLRAAKLGINSTWKRLLSNNNIPVSAKYKVFSAASRTILEYASQVWGYNQYETAENLIRFFVKKLFCLPSRTPTYMLHIETGWNEIFMNTLKSHFKYILKVLKLPEHRLPAIIAKKVIVNNALWFKKWNALGKKFEIKFEITDKLGEDWDWRVNSLLEKLERSRRNEWIDRARNSQHFLMYANLKYDLNEKQYISDHTYPPMTNLIFRTRCEMIDLRFKFWETGDTTCPICNNIQQENTYHFLCACPTLSSYRKQYLKKPFLKSHEILPYLNGENWPAFYQYIKQSWKYRSQII
jgi:exonuclease III